MSFERDNDWQRRVRDRFLPAFYRNTYGRDAFIFLDKGRCSTLIQKRLAVDTIASRGIVTCIEEKFCRSPFPNFFLETESCTVEGLESQGWMRYGEADILLYAFCDNADNPTCLDTYLIDFPRLRGWFFEQLRRNPSRWRFYTMPNTTNHTRGALVPRAELAAALDPVRVEIRETSARRIAA